MNEHIQDTCMYICGSNSHTSVQNLGSLFEALDHNSYHPCEAGRDSRGPVGRDPHDSQSRMFRV